MIAGPPTQFEEAMMRIGKWLRNRRDRRNAAPVCSVCRRAMVVEEPKADVARFALAHIEVAPGSALEVGAIFMGYCDYAAKRRERALGRAEFDLVWAALCKETKLQMRRHGMKTIVEDVKLAA